MTKTKLFLTIVLILSLLTSCKPKVGGKDNPGVITSETKLDHLVIWEVFYSGSWVSRMYKGKEYGYADKKPMYIKIYNPTEEPKYLDGLCIAVSRHQTNTYAEIKLDNPEDDFFKTNFAMDEVLQFPGSGKEYVIQPGQTVTIAKMAVDFTKPNTNADTEDEEDEPDMLNPHSLDLSKVDFEWLSTSDQFHFEDCEDNSSVPNLKRNFFFEGDQGLDPTNRTLVLFEVKDSEYFTKLNAKDPTYFKQYSITVQEHHGGTHDKEAVAPVVPNEWIIDAVNISPTNDYKMKNIDEKMDAGWFGVSQNTIKSSSMKKEDTGISIRRKWNGKSYEDANNSSLDFEVVKASLDKAQYNPSTSAK